MVHVKAVLSVWGTFYQLVPKPVQLQKKVCQLNRDPLGHSEIAG